MLQYYSYAAPELSVRQMFGDDPFLSSLMARSAAFRLAGVAGLVVLLWLAIAWAAALP